MPAKTDLERRDRALIAFALLSGARDNAIASLSLRHVDVARRRVYQDEILDNLVDRSPADAKASDRGGNTIEAKLDRLAKLFERFDASQQ